MNSISDNGALIRKVYIPKYMFPLSRVTSSFVTLLFSLVALIVVMLATGSSFTVVSLLFPLPLIYVYIFTVGIGLIMATLAVFFRDMTYLYTVLLSAWMYLTPIIYPIQMVPDFVRNIIAYNPLYYYIELFREIIMYNVVPSLELNLICIGCSIASLSLGLFVFYKNQHKFVLHL